MDIGTAKPTVAQRARVPHHLIDIANPAEIISLAVFQARAQEAIADIHRRGKLPFLVGGTGQYIRAVTQGWAPPEVKPNQQLRNALEEMKEERSASWLYAKLKQLDPQAASTMDARNHRRTVRALEVILTTGRKFSAQRAQAESLYSLLTLGLTRPRAELYARIDARIDAMFAAGLVEEVRGLLAHGVSPELPSMSAIGYREAVQLATGESTADQAKAEMRRATRVFVRRQANWFKPSDPQIAWFDADLRAAQHMESYVRAWLAAN
jgi:tRNA dimethylallyltransferase